MTPETTRAADSSAIGTLNEMSLHASLKTWYTKPGDKLEVRLNGYVIDIVRGDQLIEIQTRNFSALKDKLLKLTTHFHVRLVHPIPREKWILRIGTDGLKRIGRRKSPKRGCVEQLFSELVSFPNLAVQPNLSIEVLLTQEEVVWKDDGKGSWRRKRWSISDHRLLKVLRSVVLTTRSDYQKLLPPSLPREFTTSDLKKNLGLTQRLAGQMAYCLREMGAIHKIGKRRNAYLYTINLDKESSLCGI